MKARTYELELITPCFCGGAEPEKRAEIRAPSIRGQLRWWFRTLGGFKKLAAQDMPVREQEDMIFGSVRGGKARASCLILRVRAKSGGFPTSTKVKDAEGMNARVGTDRGYLLFPLRSNPRAVFDMPILGKFDLQLVWRGDPSLWNELDALVTILGNFGALGFRSRRAMGALAILNTPMSITDALTSFSDSRLLTVRTMNATDGNNAISVLAKWLKRWRSHGRTGNNYPEQQYPGYRFAKDDHDAGLGLHTRPTFRPAIGLPIVQSYSGGRPRKNWEFGRGNFNEPKGRFASPVLLRPHRDSQGRWRALIICANSHKWPNDLATGQPKQVFIDGHARSVSLDLYEAMKRDTQLADFLTD